MFARQPNYWQDYANVETATITDAMRAEDTREQHMNEVVIPAIAERVKALHEAQQGKFNDEHHIISEFPIGRPFTVHGHRREGGPYTLTDETGSLLSRDIPPSHIKLISQDTLASGDNFYEIQAIVDHKGSPGNYIYYVRWKGYEPKDDTWEPAEHFNDIKLINMYWERHNPAQSKKQRRVVPAFSSAMHSLVQHNATSSVAQPSKRTTTASRRSERQAKRRRT